MQIPLAAPDIRDSDRAAVLEVLNSGVLSLGPKLTGFEQAVARVTKSKHAIAVNSGTSSLEIILRALDVAGRDVLVPTNTFFATAAAVVHAGGRPVFVDMDPASFAVRPEDVEKALTPRTAGFIVVHIGGLISPRLAELQELATRKGIWLVEDAAHAHGSSHQGTPAGAFGLAASFSFYPTKVMTSAEGGMIVTNDDRIDQEARIYRDQGKGSFLQNAHTRMGYNWRLSEPHAIIGLRHLERLPAMIADRQRIAAVYDKELAGLRRLRPLAVPSGGACNYYKYIAVLDEKRDRAALKKELKERHGVSLAGEVYEAPLHEQPIFRDLATGPLPVAEDLCARHLCLPVFSGMEERDAEQVVSALRDLVG